MKFKRKDVKGLQEAILLQDRFGARYTPKVQEKITAIDFHLEAEAKKVDDFFKKVSQEAVKNLGIPEEYSERSPEQVEAFNDYVDNHQEFDKFLNQSITIEVYPIKLSELQKCSVVVSIFRPYYGTLIVPDTPKGSKSAKSE